MYEDPDIFTDDDDISDTTKYLPGTGGSFEIVFEAEDAGARLDASVSKRACITRSAAQRAIEAGGAVRDGKALKKNYRVSEGETITFTLPPLESADIEPEDIPLDIIYEDDSLIVVNKPKGMVVHPGPGHFSGTLVSALLWHCSREGSGLSGIGGVIRPGIVHRIDADTSGLLVAAKTDAAHQSLAGQIKDRSAKRVYEALISGDMKNEEGVIDAPIGRHPTDRIKMAVITDDRYFSRPAVTHWKALEHFRGYCHIECRLETGRTHQIRVHMNHINHHLLCNPLYGMKGASAQLERRYSELCRGQCLCARVLGFNHPLTGEYMEFKAPLPDYFEEMREILRKQ
ncbi:MAG: RluA family pseudouridine synthase [Clostridiales bacterium]|nr:RluA family pseudouridine synthase [Clostridiales bacterium]